MPPQQLRRLAQPPAKTNPAQKCSGLHAYTSLPWAAWAAVTSSHCSPANKTLKVVAYLGIAKRPHHHHPHSNRPHHPSLYSLLTPISSLSNSQYLHVRSADWGSIFCSATGGGGTKTKKNPQASGTVSPSPGLKETHNWNTAQSTAHLSSPSLRAHSSISPYN